MYTTLLTLHIAAGSLALLSALGALLVAKGKLAHRRFGMAYVCSMGMIAVTAWAMSAIKLNAFLFSIGCFSAYLVASGYARAKNRSGLASGLDWSIAAFGLISSCLMFWLGWTSTGTNHVVLLVFAGIAAALVLVEMNGLRKSAFKGSQRIISHMTQMMGGTIATVTAVAVVNIRGVAPGWLVWLAPTVLIVPLIVYWTIRLRVSK